MVDTMTTTLADRLAARKVSTATPSATYQVATDRYHLVATVQAGIEALKVVGMTNTVEQYFDALDATRIVLETLDETVSVKVAIKRAQEAIYARNRALEDKDASDDASAIKEFKAEADEYQTVIDEIYGKLAPFGINQSHNANKLEGLWYYGDLKLVDDEHVDALLPKKRVRQ